MHYGTKPGHFETLRIHFSTSEGVRKVSERANEWAQQRAQVKWAVRSKRASERGERTNERTSEWPSTYVSIFGWSRPQCTVFWSQCWQPRKGDFAVKMAVCTWWKFRVIPLPGSPKVKPPPQATNQVTGLAGRVRKGVKKQLRRRVRSRGICYSAMVKNANSNFFMSIFCHDLYINVTHYK